jgi:sigma-B regulation protein RsbU (phosphoserine phosphatase)
MSKVLIVDDESDIELLVTQAFKRRAQDFQFVFARDGREALEKLDNDPELDLVITDINMPVMDGLALLAAMNSRDGRILKAVVLSAYGDMQNIRAAMNCGAFDFLTKPIDFRDFETTLRRTREAIDAARAGHAAREQLLALEHELDIAARIQESILPSEFFPGRKEFELWADMQTARRVGGDLYDFFALDERRVGFLIGDVAGKGIPAALFMAVSRTILHAAALQDFSPGDCLTYANEVLLSQGQNDVYVTVFYGVLDTATGEISYAIGGHNPPLHVGACGRSTAVIREPSGLVVGLIAEARYETGHFCMHPGDTLFLYTDGVTEAMNAQQEFFGFRRTRSLVTQCNGQGPEAMIASVAEAVAEFTAGAPPSDDITMLALRWLGPQHSTYDAAMPSKETH